MKANKALQWFLGSAIIICIVLLIIFYPYSILFYHDLPYVNLFKRAFFVLLLCALLCLFRIYKGPTASDRIVAIDILGILIVGFCAVISVPTGRTWYIDIAIAWALQSFIGTLALAKYLEGRGFDE